MNRRTYLASVCAAGVAATAGCSTISGSKTLSEPTVNTESSGRKALIFTENDEEVGHLSVDGSVTSGRIDLSTEIWHRGGTNVESIKLRVWMPETAMESPAEVAVVSPVEGDSSPPPSVATGYRLRSEWLFRAESGQLISVESLKDGERRDETRTILLKSTESRSVSFQKRAELGALPLNAMLSRLG